MKENRCKCGISLQKVGEVLFYAGLLVELLILILDKAAWINPYESMMFRAGFLMFALKVCFTRYSAKEWLAIIGAGIIAGICYLVSERDEAVRFVVFVASMKGINGKRCLKTVFWITGAGMAGLAALSAAGILGTVYEMEAGYGFKANLDRLCLGLGNSNALSIMVWALMTLGIYLYHEKLKLWDYGILLIAAGAVYVATVTRTSFLVTVFTLVLAFVMQYWRKLRDSSWVYGGGVIVTLFCVGFSVWAAYVSDWYSRMPAWVEPLDRLLTGRIVSLYTYEDGGAVLERWRLFSDPSYTHYFDMGYVRLFFWYGIIPGICCVSVLCMLIWNFRQNRDYMGFVLTIAFAVFTVIEAHAVSVYLARNYVLFLLGMYWPQLLGKQAEEANWWRIHTLIKRR